ncbi:MAG: NFACT family protein [Candidatus Woesearchaeota archaeon]
MILGKDLANIEVKEFCKEFKKFENSYIDKIYYENQALEIRLNHSELGKINLFFSHPYIYLTRKIQLNKTLGFGLILKKYLEHSKILSIEQLGSDRVIVLKLSNKLSLVFELFFHGNVMILESNKILAQSNPKGGSKKEKEYFSIEKKEDIFSISFDEFRNKMKDKELVKGLANFIGNVYAEEICHRLKIDKLTKDYEIEKVYDEFLKLINEENLFLFYPEKNCFSVRELKMYENNEKVQFNSFSEMLEEISKKEIQDEMIEKYKKAIEIQRKTIEEYENKIQNYEKTIEVIYSNYLLLEKILKIINENENNDKIIEEINKKLEENKINIRIKEMDKKNKEFSIVFQ